MTNKKLTEKDIDDAILNAEKKIDKKKIKTEKRDDVQVCPKCKGKDLEILSKDDLFVYYKCNTCNEEFTAINEDHLLI